MPVPVGGSDPPPRHKGRERCRGMAPAVLVAGYPGGFGREDVMRRTAIGLALAVLWGAGCAPADQEVPASSPATGSESPSALASGGSPGDTIPGLPSWTREDWEVLRRTVAGAWQS